MSGKAPLSQKHKQRLLRWNTRPSSSFSGPIVSKPLTPEERESIRKSFIHRWGGGLLQFLGSRRR